MALQIKISKYGCQVQTPYGGLTRFEVGGFKGDLRIW